METLRIIVAEDEQRILHHIVSKIQSTVSDCEIIATANNGEDALVLAEKYHPDVVFSDIKMPRMDGLELSRLLRERLPDTFVVLLSGYSDFSFAREAIRYGVSYYLLKPLDEEELLEVTEEIREKLEEIRHKRAPLVLLSEENGLGPDAQENADGLKYYVVVCCFYNLYCAGTSKTAAEDCAESLAKIDWAAALRAANPCCKEWMVADGTPANMKNIILTISGECGLEIEAFAGHIRSYLHANYPEHRVNLCYHTGPVETEEIWNHTVRMKKILEKMVVPAREQIFVLEENEIPAPTELYDAAKVRLQSNAKALLKTSNYQALLEELNTIVAFSLNNLCTQKQLLKILGDIFKLIEGGMELDPEVLEQIKAEKEKLYDAISFTGQQGEILESFAALLSVYFQDVLDLSASQKSKEEIIAYVEDNYTVIDSVEQVAEKFNYNYTYISRMFRVIKGVSMVKYITNKRIETAKKIMKENPELSISSVCNMVGYMDQHYFSRVFRSITGSSPKEYKKMLQR